jgi:hypothetical protein
MVDNARLERIEDKLNELSHTIASFCSEASVDLRRLNAEQNMHRVMIYGDGNGMRGLDKRVDRLEQADKQKKWWVATMIAAAGAAISAWVANVLTTLHGKP